MRIKWRRTYRHFTAAMESVNIAEAQVKLWSRQNDAFTDTPFWKHSNTNEMSWTKPHILMYLPPHFEIPTPPDPLPEGINIDDTSDEDNEKAAAKVEAAAQAKQEKADAAERAKKERDAQQAAAAKEKSAKLTWTEDHERIFTARVVRTTTDGSLS